MCLLNSTSQGWTLSFCSSGAMTVIYIIWCQNGFGTFFFPIFILSNFGDGEKTGKIIFCKGFRVYFFRPFASLADSDEKK